MSTTVCKFGGSSVSDAGMFMRVARIIRSDPSRKYIVLSAPGKRMHGDEKITDLFYRAHAAQSNLDHSILAGIYERYASIRNALAPDFDLESEFALIRAKLHTSPDYAASRGEYLCAKLFAAYIQFPFVDASELLCFDAQGNINMDSTFRAVQEKLAPLHCAVIPGFYGTGPDGSIKTFSRGGSDVSGALIAAALDAGLYENWTDVDGLFTADPRIIPTALRNSTVNLLQMEEIARAGANLMHPDALLPLHGRHIDTLLKNTFFPGAPGTRISEDFIGDVRCVTGRRSMYMLGDPVLACDEKAQPLLHSFPLAGCVQVARVSIFGMNKERARRMQELLNPIHIIHMHNHIQIIIPDQEYESTIRTAHALLLE